MTNITVSVDDGTYRRARVAAAEKGGSVSSLVREFLASLEPSSFDKARMREQVLRGQITNFDPADRLDREALHRRDF